MIFDEGGRIGMGTSRAKYVVESVIEKGTVLFIKTVLLPRYRRATP